MSKLTKPQAALLERMPRPPSDGLYCKGPALRVAEALVRKGLARKVSAGLWAGGCFVRIDKPPHGSLPTPDPDEPYTEGGVGYAWVGGKWLRCI